MLKKFAVVVLLIVVVACVSYVVSAMHKSAPPAQASAATLPGNFGKITPAATESQVVALVGQPQQKSHYARYEKKPASYWAALQQQVDAGDKLAVYNSTPNMAYIRARAELTHRYKDVWLYKPAPRVLMTLYFGDDGTLLNMGLSSAGGDKNGPGAMGGHGAPPH